MRLHKQCGVLLSCCAWHHPQQPCCLEVFLSVHTINDREAAHRYYHFFLVLQPSPFGAAPGGGGVFGASQVGLC